MDSTKVLGIAAAIFTATSMVPQLIKILKQKKAESVSIGTVMVLLCGLVLWVWYGFKKDDVPIIATNAFSIIINILLVFFGIKYKEKNKRSG